MNYLNLKIFETTPKNLGLKHANVKRLL